MALTTIQDPSAHSQGAETVVADMVFGTPTGNQVTVTSAGTNLPLLLDNEFVEIRDQATAENNGLYKVNDASPSTGSVTLDKVSGANPSAASSESASIFSHTDTTVSDMVFANASGYTVDITSAGGNLPSMAVGERFVVLNHSTSENNGAYKVTVINTDQQDYTCEKLDKSTTAPSDASSESADTYTDVKTVMFETAGLGMYLLEPPSALATQDLDGTNGQALYSFAVNSWIADNFLMQAADFPMQCIDSDAGKYLVGQDPSGFKSGWTFVDVPGESIRTRKLLRNAGWNEIASDGNLDYQYAGIKTIGTVLDTDELTGDTAYYHFGSDTTVDNSVDFAFAGPVNEAVLVYDGLATPVDTGTGFAITTTDTITRNDGGNWITEGYIVGGQITILDAEDSGNIGTFVIASLTSSVLVVVGTPLTNNAADNTFFAAVDNRNEINLKLRVRTTSGDSNARTFAQSNLAAADESVLANRVFKFGLSNAQDLDITASDATIAGSAPYTGMSITFNATPQARGGSGDLVGGPYNFGIIVEGNDGTNTECYEFIQYSLRQAADIDADADTNIGKMIDGLCRFLGPTLQVGSVDGGVTFPTNPDGGGSGVFIDSLNSASRNDTIYYDNTGTARQHPLGVAVTLDFNATALADVNYKYTLFFDYTRTRTVSDLVITAVSGPTGTFDSAGAGLTALDVGAGQYVRVSGLTGADEPMNGIYQVTAETSTSQWDVTRADGATIVTTSSASAPVDEYPVNSPDAIIVEDDAPADVTGTNPSADVVFTFDYTGNVQGGRTPSTDASVVLRTVGKDVGGAQYAQTPVLTIPSTAVTLPVSNNIELNFLDN